MEIIEDTPMKFETILIIDTEGNHELREIGAILWNLRTNETVEFSSHMPHSVVKLNEFKGLIAKCDGIIGHGIGCDKSLLKRNSIDIDGKMSICSYNNFKWPNYLKSLRLKNICEYFNIEPIDIHSAIADCRLLKQCLLKIPDYFSQLQDAFEKKKKSQKIIQLIYPDTKLVEFKNGCTILAQYVTFSGGLREYTGKHDDGLIIPCPLTIETNGTLKLTIEIVKRLQYYIANNYPILVKRVRINRGPHVLFIIGKKINDMSQMEMNNEQATPPQHIFKKNIRKRKHSWKTINLITHGQTVTPCKQNDNIIAQFRKRSNGNFSKCRVTTIHKILSTVQFPESIEILDNVTYIETVEKMKTYIPNHAIRVDRIQDQTSYGLLFSIGEPISKSCDMEYIESKSESFRIQNQTNFNDGIFLQYLDENKSILTLLQENRLRFAPICLNDLRFNMYWNTTANTLEIVPDQS